ncbi:EAL and HDOD domain-containing protein [Sulfuriferula nivalis]|uniref:Cyclic diguanylate phosphodiesterase n=1 Tax=Sulfuriferula nivalis TaxID=2675298 RepID=A0A809SBT4_9PROT|nr:HDOD domain-containing protein [Sulfuriferula nivalis]BBO99416.1 cyclic diguanylate phosphodiesterase [Sulfuriferula nivalis]
MLGNLFKAFGKKEPSQEQPPDAKPDIPPPPTVDEVVPALTPQTLIATTKTYSINTSEVDATTTVVDALDIPTYGERNNPIEMTKRFLGRQPIFSNSQSIIGYEFSLRNQLDAPVTATIQQMQDEMLIASITDLDLKPMLGNKVAFISISPPMLASDWLVGLPSFHIVLALNSTQITDPNTTLALCQQRIAEGFCIAIDNPTFSAEQMPIIALAKYIRFDTEQYSAIELSKHMITTLGRSKATIIAKHVESEDEYVAYQSMMFHAFQGYFFTHAIPNQAKRIDKNRAHVIELLNMVIKQAEIHELEAVLKRDAVLSYKLLSFINSAANGLTRKLESISQALILLGYQQFYRWLTLLMFSSGNLDARGRALLQNALIRGRLTELLGENTLPASERDSLFIVGIFSLLDTLLNTPIKSAVAELNLNEALTQALVDDNGPYAPYLRLAIACEQGDQAQISELAQAIHLDVNSVNVMHVKTLIWAEGFTV